MKNAWRSQAAGAALIVMLTVAAYLPVTQGGFIWDDDTLITQNRLVKASDGLYRFWFTTEAPESSADYYPLAWSLWWLEWHLWGDSATGYHVVNVLLHAVDAVLVWMVLRRLKIPGAWLAATVFAVHPVNVATVAWISEQKNTLSMLFYLVTILLYLRFDEDDRWRWPRPRSRGWLGLSLAAFLLALLSKSAVVMLPVVLLGCAWWRRGRVSGRDWLGTLPFFVLSLASGLAAIWFTHKTWAGNAVQTVGFLSRLAAAGWVPWFYLDKALLPFDLTVVYPKWEINASYWVSYVPGVALVGCFALFWWKRQTWGRPLLFGLGYFVVTLFPVWGFFDQGFYQYSLVADHWQYYSIVGVIALSVAEGAAICRRIGQPSRSADVLMGAILLAVLAVATWRRSSVYADSKTLWGDALAKNPDAWVAHNNLGLALSQEGKLGDAIWHYEQALRVKPNYAEARNNLGIALKQMGRVQEAIEQYEQTLRIDPAYAMAHNNLGVVLAQTGRTQEAIGYFEQALRLKPDYAEAHNNLAVALIQQGKIQEAVEHWKEAVRLEPDDAEVHCNLGNALFALGQVPEAIGHFEQALRIKPDFTEAHANLQRAQQALAKPQEPGVSGR